MLNLIDTAVFPLEIMEMAIQTEKFNRNVISPCKRIAELWGIVDRMQIMQTQCMYVADALERKYKERLKICHKADALKNYIKTHRSYEIAIVVPKAYYKELLRMVFAEYFCDAKIVCVTANRFDINQKYDYILCVGNINNKRFDPLQCFSARNIDVLLYSYEEIVFNYRRQRITAYKNMLNQKSGTKFKKVETCDSYSSEKQMDVIVRQFCDLDEYIENFNFFDITRFAQKNTTERNTVPVSEVKYIGSFISGERIFFSKYYSAVVFDNVTGSVVEKSPELLQAGDVLVFTKRDNYTKNIVDIVYERLLNEGRLGLGAIESYEKSQYWKEVLREYKKNNNFTYRNVSQRMHDVGSSVQEVTVRQWLVEESHIVGPREGVTMQHIANITNDPYLLADPQAFFEACIAVRRDRRKILNLISIAINEKLKGNYPGDESIMSVVYDNIDNLSKTIELEHVSELDSSININSSFVNIPLTGGEVLL